jgi:hypothetical protein
MTANVADLGEFGSGLDFQLDRKGSEVRSQFMKSSELFKTKAKI